MKKTNKTPVSKVVKVVKPTYQQLVDANAKLVKECNEQKDKNLKNVSQILNTLRESVEFKVPTFAADYYKLSQERYDTLIKLCEDLQ